MNTRSFNKNICLFITIILIIVFIVLMILLLFELTKDPAHKNNKSCVIDADCVVCGEEGDCDCGCFNKDYNWVRQGNCFCATPVSCQCTNGECHAVFNH